MGRNLNFRSFCIKAQVIRNFQITLIHYYYHYLTIGIHERGCQQLASAGGTDNAFGTHADEF